MFQYTPEIPSWVSFPQRSPAEKMLRQFSAGIPGLVQDEEGDWINAELPDFLQQTVLFYRRYLAVMEEGDDSLWDAFALNETYASGFQTFLRQLPDHLAGGQTVMLKGQVTGPLTMGINLLDQDRRCSYYDEQLRDILVKMTAVKAVWQLRQWKRFGLPALIVIEEPALLLLGRTLFLPLERKEVIQDLNTVAQAIHAFGGLVGVRGEENMDWSLLLSTDVDLVAFDAYDHFSSLALYPEELRAFLDRGGWLGWGMIPTQKVKRCDEETIAFLLKRFEEGLEQLNDIYPQRDLLLRRSMITLNTGGGGIWKEEEAEQALALLRSLSLALRKKYGLL